MPQQKIREIESRTRDGIAVGVERAGRQSAEDVRSTAILVGPQMHPVRIVRGPVRKVMCVRVLVEVKASLTLHFAPGRKAGIQKRAKIGEAQIWRAVILGILRSSMDTQLCGRVGSIGEVGRGLRSTLLVKSVKIKGDLRSDGSRPGNRG